MAQLVKNGKDLSCMSRAIVDIDLGNRFVIEAESATFAFPECISEYKDMHLK